MTDTTWFNGSKCAVFVGSRLVVLRRDDKPDIPYPDRLDIPGGEREPGETPEETAVREIREEIGLELDVSLMKDGRTYEGPFGRSWFFVAHLPAEAEADIVFGDEGQGWALMTCAEFVSHPDAIGHLADLVRRLAAPPPDARG
ncbi:NUDIX domain-containing protein [Primorskyibacter sp. S187A]|uniref:NUDIX domain-containing protein n=1 Tax=Primorskyibacter sp. S187A TaxID=3415130 RepID=UPI003C7B6E8D